MRNQLLSMPSIIRRPLWIASREHILLIAAGCTEALKGLKSSITRLCARKGPSRQVLSIVVLRNRKDLVAYFFKGLASKHLCHDSAYPQYGQVPAQERGFC